MKKILFLGGAPTQIPPIKYALEQGYYVISCDFLPDNPGHILSHEYHNISTTDKDAILSLAESLKIDGIVAYASDPAAPTAAYVAEKMGLPGNPYKSVEILARKDLFRSFLLKHNFNVPKSKSFYNIQDAKEWLDTIELPVFVKPVDSSGSKGVTQLFDRNEINHAFKYALSFSREKKVIIEEKIIKQGYQVAGDGFIIDGELRFRCWADEHFDKLCNGLVPIGQTFPTTHPENLLMIAHNETQRLLKLLDMKQGALNFDFMFDEQGRFFFLELGPRNGGCLIPEVIKYITGVDLIAATVDAAMGLPVSISMTPTNGFWSSYMVHSITDGEFQSIYISPRAKNYIVEQDIQIRENTKVSKFSGSNCTIGSMILHYPSQEEMLEMIDSMENDIRVITK